jgi:hypothetical protein
VLKQCPFGAGMNSTNFTCSFFDEVARISAPEYIPTEADVLRARTKTTGIYETRFTMGQLSIQYVYPTDRALFVADVNIVCLMLVVKEVSERNGYIASKTSHPSSFVLL